MANPYYFTPPSLYNKSIVREMFVQMEIAAKEAGRRKNDGLFVIIDELGDIAGSGDYFSANKPCGVPHPGDVLNKLHDPEWPDCDVSLVLEKIDKRDPLHPNPRAGTIRKFFVVHGTSREPVKNRTLGLNRVKEIHRRLVDQKVAQQKEMQRKRALAAEQAIEEARRNQEHLASLPTFGGF